MMLSVDWEQAGKRLKQALGLSHAPIAITFLRKHRQEFLYMMGRCLLQVQMDAPEK